MGITRGAAAGAAAVLTAAAAVLGLAACAGTDAGTGSGTGKGAGADADASARAGGGTDFRVHADTLPPSGIRRYAPPSITAALRPGATGTPSRDECAGDVGGPRVTVSPVDAAMGLRATTITLTNCDDAPLTVRGYPDLRPLDAAGNTLRDVAVHHGITVTTGIPDPGPKALTLRRGEQVIAVLAWRNLVTDTTVTATAAPAFAVVPTPGAAPQVLHETLDVGNTGRVDLTAWHRDTR